MKLLPSLACAKLVLLAATFLPPPPKVQWLCIGAPAWCAPCRKAEADFKPWLEQSRWRVGPEENAHVRLIDIDCETELAQEFKITSVPTFVLVVDGEERKRFVGYPGRQTLVREYLREARK